MKLLLCYIHYILHDEIQYIVLCITQLYIIAEGMSVISPPCNSNIADIGSLQSDKKERKKKINKKSAYDFRIVKISGSPSFFPYWMANQPTIQKYITKKQACLNRAILIACGSTLGTQM